MWPMRWSRRSCSRRGPVRKCLSVILFERRGVLIKSDALGHRYGTYPLRCQTWELPLPAPTTDVRLPAMTYPPCYWHLVTTTGHLSKLDHLSAYSLPYWYWHLVARTLVMLCCLFQVCVLDRSVGVHWGVTGGYVLESMRTCLHWGRGRFTTAVLVELL